MRQNQNQIHGLIMNWDYFKNQSVKLITSSCVNANSKLEYSRIKNHYERTKKDKNQKANHRKKLLLSYHNDVKLLWKTVNEIIGRS